MENYEIWKDCKGYEGRYQISNKGRVWSVKKQNYMKPQTTKNGYMKIGFYAKNGKKKNEYIHRLVALAFLPNPTGLGQVNHIDKDKTNNCVENLEWCDAKYNVVYTHGKPIRCIELNKIFDCATNASKELSINVNSIYFCCKGKTQTAGGYHWEYVGD